MKRTTLFTLLLLTYNLFAQDGVIQGTVQDRSGEPLWGSNVYLLGTSLGASTDSAGFYRIENIPIDKYTLVCDYIGYRSGKRSIYISAFDTEGDTQGDESYLDKMGVDQDDNDSGIDVLKGKNLDGVNFILEEDVFNSQEVVVTGVASERSVEVSEVAV